MQAIINKFVEEFSNQPTSYYIAQFFGLLVTIGVIISLQMKKKVQMQTLSVFVNLFSAINIFLLEGKFNSGVIVCCVAIAQLISSIIHEIRGTRVTLAEKIIFLILYVAGGLTGFIANYMNGNGTPLDLLSTVAAVFYMIAMFQKKEQHIRLFLLANLSCWTVYLSITRSISVFAQIAGIISSLIALFRYRKDNKNSTN